MMKRLVDGLAPLGLLVIVGAQVWVRTGRTLPGRPEAYLIGGAALVVAHLVLRWQDVAEGVGRRQLRYGSNTLVLTAAVAGILVALNYLTVRHTLRWDLTKDKRYSLSPQTKKILAGLKEDVKITYFQRAANLGAGKDRLKDFAAGSPRIKTDFVDPFASPARAREYDVRGPWPMLVLERGAKREKISNDSEQDLANALIKVTRDAKKTVCFAYGEDERDIEDSGQRGFSAAKGALARSQYETKKVLLLREGKVPGDCTVLVVPGPRQDLVAPVIDALRSFVKGGGKALVMVEPEQKEAFPNLVGLLKEWNIEAGKDIVVDVSGLGQLFGADELTPVAAQYPYHEITKDFRVMTAFHLARSMQAGTGTVEGVSVQNLVQTSPESWAESDLSLKGRVEYNEGKDRKGPISLGAVATVRAAEPKPAASPSPAAIDEKKDEPKPEGRVVAFGDSDFASNVLLGFQGNQDFFLNTVAWLAQDADLISIRPKEPEDQRLTLPRAQQQTLAYVSLVVLPGLFVVAGVVTWWKRR